MKEEITVSGLTVTYGDVVAMRDATFTAQSGTVTGILGPNGSGKTSLMKGMLGLVRTSSGTTSFSGQRLSRVRQQVAYVPQRKEIDWDFPITVADMVLMGTYPRLGMFDRPGPEERRRADESLERVGMSAFRGRQIGELSGGQQQRVFIARALAQAPTYMFLDEPFTGVDVKSSKTIVDVLDAARSDNTTILIVDHDLARAKAKFDQIILVDHEVVAAGTPDEVLTASIITDVYLTDGSADPTSSVWPETSSKQSAHVSQKVGAAHGLLS